MNPVKVFEQLEVWALDMEMKDEILLGKRD